MYEAANYSVRLHDGPDSKSASRIDKLQILHGVGAQRGITSTTFDHVSGTIFA
jgi:hypothetical protein